MSFEAMASLLQDAWVLEPCLDSCGDKGPSVGPCELGPMSVTYTDQQGVEHDGFEGLLWCYSHAELVGELRE